MSPYTCVDCGREYRTELGLAGHICSRSQEAAGPASDPPSKLRAKAATLNPNWPETTDTWRAIESLRSMVYKMNTRSTIELNEPGAHALLQACDDVTDRLREARAEIERLKDVAAHCEDLQYTIGKLVAEIAALKAAQVQIDTAWRRALASELLSAMPENEAHRFALRVHNRVDAALAEQTKGDDAK